MKSEMGGARSTYGEKRNAYKILIGKPEGERPLGRHNVSRRIILKYVLRKSGWA
jgi:hypothetical protein